MVARQELRTRRPWIRVQLNTRPEAHQTYAITEAWKSQGQCTANLIAAIQVYEGLLRGDTAALHKYLPGLALALQRPAPAPAATTTLQPLTVSQAPRSEADDLADAQSLFDDDLEF